MTVECDEEFDWPAAPDQLRLAALPLIEHIFAVTAEGSAERSKAMDVVLTAAEKVCLALRPKPTIN